MAKYDKLDNIVCLGVGIASSTTATILTDLAIQSSQKYGTPSRVALDIAVGVGALLAGTIAAYATRNSLFYETTREENSTGGSRGGYTDITTTVKDRRTGEVVSVDCVSGKEDNR